MQYACTVDKPVRLFERIGGRFGHTLRFTGKSLGRGKKIVVEGVKIFSFDRHERLALETKEDPPRLMLLEDFSDELCAAAGGFEDLYKKYFEAKANHQETVEEQKAIAAFWDSFAPLLKPYLRSLSVQREMIRRSNFVVSERTGNVVFAEKSFDLHFTFPF